MAKERMTKERKDEITAQMKAQRDQLLSKHYNGEELTAREKQSVDAYLTVQKNVQAMLISNATKYN